MGWHDSFDQDATRTASLGSLISIAVDRYGHLVDRIPKRQYAELHGYASVHDDLDGLVLYSWWATTSPKYALAVS